MQRFFSDRTIRQEHVVMDEFKLVKENAGATGIDIIGLSKHQARGGGG